jgi:hypothetical protein
MGVEFRKNGVEEIGRELMMLRRGGGEMYGVRVRIRMRGQQGSCGFECDTWSLIVGRSR